MPDSRRTHALHLAGLFEEGNAWRAFEVAEWIDGVEGYGFRRVLETRIVADLLATKGIGKTIPQLTESFQEDFSSFDLTGAEGYLISLIDGILDLEKILLISTLGRFPTLLALERLREKGVLTFGGGA